MLVPRAGHTATLLEGSGCGSRCGQVLVVGGNVGSSTTVPNSSNSVELYNPSTGTWTAAAPFTDLRSNHTATLLRTGKVLVTGGLAADIDSPDAVGQRVAVATDSAELYDPVADSWSATATPLTRARAFHTATLLNDGTVLLAGRIEPNGITAEVLDPTTGAFSATGAMATARSEHTATLLASGTVLVTGGTGGGNTAELYDPVARTWTVTGSMLSARAGHTASLLLDGRVLIAGGTGAGATSERYNPTTGVWKATAPLTVARAYQTATSLPGGKVLVTGGSGLASAEVFRPIA